MRKPQLITIAIGLLLTAGIYFLARTTPKKKTITASQEHGPGDGHNHETTTSLTIDTFLTLGKRGLNSAQLARLNSMEKSLLAAEAGSSKEEISRQQLHIYRQLALFWYDTANSFEPYAWYEAEAARLENSEKSLTFAARLFLDNLQNDGVTERRRWKALQAKDLFERSLKVNPQNDSAKVGLGACYLFGGISAAPMEGILKIREVAEKDSTNIYAQMMLARGSIVSGQYDKAIARLQTVNRLQPADIETALLLAELYERTGDKSNAIQWYKKSLPLVKQEEIRKDIKKRIEELSK